MWHRISRALLIFVGTLLILGIAPTAAQDGNEAVNLSIQPVGTTENYFTLTAEPGDILDLEVELANHGSIPVTVQTYAANAYSLINGGFGVALADEGISGTTEWIDYPAETFELDAQTSTIRSVRVAIPADAQAGEYLTALVIQNAVPTESTGQGVGFKQVNRQAIAIAIKLPGAVAPGLAIGEVTHKVAGGNLVLLVGVENTGNTHMNLEGEIVLTDPEGDVILERHVSMQTIYAGTATQLEVPVKAALDGGEYLVSLNLGNESLQISESVEAAPVTIPTAAEPASAAAADAEPAPADQSRAEVDADVAAVNPKPNVVQSADATSQAASGAQSNGAEPAQQEGGISMWMLIAGIGAALVLGAGGAILGIALMRHRGETSTSSPVVEAPAPVSGGSEPAPRQDPEPASELVAAPVAAPKTAKPQPQFKRRSSKSVRNLLEASSFVRGDLSSANENRGNAERI